MHLNSVSVLELTGMLEDSVKILIIILNFAILSTWKRNNAKDPILTELSCLLCANFKAFFWMHKILIMNNLLNMGFLPIFSWIELMSYSMETSNP